MIQRVLNFFVNCLRSVKVLPEYPSKISRETLQSLPIRFYDGNIQRVDTPALAIQAVDQILQESVVGFDTESKPAFIKGEKYNPSLIQIATASGVYIFQLSKIEQIKHIKPILENAKILKVGIAIRDDVLRLRDIENFSPAGFKDISELTKSMGIEQTGLRNLAGIFLKCRISKSSQITDWSQENLSARQLTYAATDAWISHQLYLTISEKIR